MAKRKPETAVVGSSHISRKDLRKEKRKLKKQNKQDNLRKKLIQKKKFESNREQLSGKKQNDKPGKFVLLSKREKCNNSKLENTETVIASNKPKGKKRRGQSLGEKMNDEILQEKQKFRTVENAMKKQRNRQLRDANKNEEKTIKLLEKQLKLNKRKNQSIPRSFVDSGLDYILDVCDSSKVQAAVQAEMNLQESASEFEEDLAMITGKAQGKKKLVKKVKPKDKSRSIKASSSESLSEDDSEGSLSDGYGSGMDESDEEEFSSDENSDSSDDAPEEASSKRGAVSKQKVNSKPIKDDIYERQERPSREDIDAEDDGDSSDFEEDQEFRSDSEDESQLPEVHPTKESKQKRKGEANLTSLKTNKKLKVSDSLSGDESLDDNDFDDSVSEDENVKEQKDDGVHEDIYGRLRDKHGNVIQPTTGKYVPPHLRAQPVDDKKKGELEKLNKTVKGLLNRLAENNMHSISNQIDDLYMRHSRYDMNNTLLKQYLDSLVSPVHTPERLMMEHAMLIAVLHANVGSEVGAFFLQHLGKQFDQMHKLRKEIENKELDNLIQLLCHMYTFKIFDSVLLYDILQRLAESFTPKDVDLILVVLRTVGFSMRKDNPLALKDFIQKVQKLANEAGDMKDDSRVRFMLDILLSIKNNNVSKIPQYDTTHSEHLKKIIKPMFRKGNYVTELKITLEELLKADERGKWWVVGSAWTGPAPQTEKPSAPTSSNEANSFTQEILDLAKKQRMNTANRKNIFCILMTAEDYLDAFEKLLKLGLRGQPEQDIVNVLIHCLLSETNYNPYYSLIADQLCMSDRRHRMTIQYSVWDRFKELKSHSNHQITNLAKFLAHLFLQNSLPLSILKVLEFTEMDKPCVRLLRQVLLSLLLHEDKEAMVAVFSRVAKPTKLLVFRESIRLFMHHFLLKNINDESDPESVTLKDSISLAEQALMTFSDR